MTKLLNIMKEPEIGCKAGKLVSTQKVPFYLIYLLQLSHTVYLKYILLFSVLAFISLPCLGESMTLFIYIYICCSLVVEELGTKQRQERRRS